MDEKVEKAKALRDQIVELGGSETLLVVEDDAPVRKSVCRTLSRRGYKVLQAGSGEDALRLCEQYPEDIAMVLTDVVLTGMSGRDLADALISTRPGLKVLFMSGYADNAIVHHGVLEPGLDFIQKPFTPESIARKVREVLEKKPRRPA